MSGSIFSIIPDPEMLLALEPEELAGYVMEYLNGLSDQERQHINPGRMLSTLQPTDWPPVYRDKISHYHPRVEKAMREAWVWLEREGFLARYPEAHGLYFITRRGERLAKVADLEALRKVDLFPRRLLHPVIAQKVWLLFLRGEYDMAVFQAFQEVEVAVRDTGGYAPTDLGTELMRKAFHRDNGPLTDTSAPPAEREALGHLFAGAIGSYKNPHSHRRGPITAEEAVEMIMLASHLLRIVDARR